MADWVKLELDVDGFDDATFEPYLRRALSSGTEFATMAELGDGPDQRRALYELNKACSADIPGRGPFSSYEEYVTDRIDVPTFAPGGVVIATRGADWIGMSATSSSGRRAIGGWWASTTPATWSPSR